MICSYCGAEFAQKTYHQKFCSKKCRDRDYAARHRKTYVKECRHCGKRFATDNSKAVYCSNECKFAASTDKRGDKDREFTPLTAYLCQKWRKEGMAVKEISLILHRTPENVRKALRVKLSPGQYAAMEVYKR